MKIRVDFYRTGGKWYSGGEADICYPLWGDDLIQELVNKQDIMTEGWQGNYLVVTSDTCENQLDNDFRGFNFRHFMPWEFIGYKRQ